MTAFINMIVNLKNSMMRYIIYIFLCGLLFSCKAYAYKFDSMRHFYIDNNTKKEVYYRTADFPKQMYLIKSDDSISWLRIFPETVNSKLGISTYYDYQQLNSFDEDTIKCDIFIDSKSTIIKKIWYNDS